jgi:hypothetical protein
VREVLELLAETRDGLTLATLSRRLPVPKSSLLALLRTFVDRRYLGIPRTDGGAVGDAPSTAQRLQIWRRTADDDRSISSDANRAFAHAIGALRTSCVRSSPPR